MAKTSKTKTTAPKETLTQLSERVSDIVQRTDQNFSVVQQQNAQLNQALLTIQQNVNLMGQKLAERTIREKALALAIESLGPSALKEPAFIVERAVAFEKFLLGPTQPAPAPPAPAPSQA